MWSDKKYKNYDRLQWVKDGGLLDVVAAACGDGEALIDLGCGTGAMVSRLSTQFTRCVGVDPSPRLLEEAPRLPNVEYVQAPLEALERRAEFDCVLLRNTLHHLRDPSVGVEVARDLLRPGGNVVLCEGVPPASDIVPFYTRLFELFDRRHILTEGDLIAFLRLHGFADIAMRPYFMENVDLIEWLSKVSPNTEAEADALAMHRQTNHRFRRVYEVVEGDRHYTMTWRFAVLTAAKPDE